MISTGWDYCGPNPYHTKGVFEQIWGLSSINSQYYWYNYGFCDLEYDEKMKLAFVRAIISDDCTSPASQWRKDNGIKIDGVRYLNLKVSDEVDCKTTNSLFALLNEAKSKKLTVQLNSVWPQAINIHSVLLSPGKTEWNAILKYGFDGSLWTHTLATQGDNTFNNFLDEACNKLNELTSK
jgi:hypothetical protein